MHGCAFIHVQIHLSRFDGPYTVHYDKDPLLPSPLYLLGLSSNLVYAASSVKQILSSHPSFCHIVWGSANLH